MQIILVDHNESAQSIGALEEADLVEVLDHHRLGNPQTSVPIPFTIDPVGSTCTLVTERVAASGCRPGPPMAGLLLAGILADTLVLKSPTTTPRDHHAARLMAGWCLRSPEVPYETIEAYGAAVLAAGAGLAVRDIDSVLNSDLKLYDGSDFRFGIAQVEVGNLVELTERLPEITAGLEALAENKALGLAVLMVTDVVRGMSRLVLAGEQAGRLTDLPYKRLPDGTLEARDVVSRKKQLLPVILGLVG
jgi:manganese-dependent inorganic pyrophosphatase